MPNHAIILGDPNCILRLPKASLRNVNEWAQLDSDILAHLIQVQSQIQNSRWNKSDITFKTQGKAVLDHSFPQFEDFVFAMVYLRQLFAKKDQLLRDAITRFNKFADCYVRQAWLLQELASFNRVLDGNAFGLPGYTTRDVFEAFMYGAGLLHKFPVENDGKRKRFLELYDHKPRHILLFSLNMSMKTLMNYVGNVTVVIYRDYSHWLSDYDLPLPDTRWHSNLFDVDPSK